MAFGIAQWSATSFEGEYHINHSSLPWASWSPLVAPSNDRIEAEEIIGALDIASIPKGETIYPLAYPRGEAGPDAALSMDELNYVDGILPFLEPAPTPCMSSVALALGWEGVHAVGGGVRSKPTWRVTRARDWINRR